MSKAILSQSLVELRSVRPHSSRFWAASCFQNLGAFSFLHTSESFMLRKPMARLKAQSEVFERRTGVYVLIAYHVPGDEDLYDQVGYGIEVMGLRSARAPMLMLACPARPGMGELPGARQGCHGVLCEPEPRSLAEAPISPHRT